MMVLRYAGGEILTGEDIAEVIVRYAAALADADTAAHVDVPGRSASGSDGRFKLLLGPASQILVEPTGDPDDVIDEEFVAGLEREIERLGRHPQALPFEGEQAPVTFDEL